MSKYVVHRTAGRLGYRYKIFRDGFTVTWTMTVWGARRAIAKDRRERTIVKPDVYTEED